MTSSRQSVRPVLALVTDAISPYHHGGKEQRTEALARHLAAFAEVHVYTMKWWPERSWHRMTADGVHLHAISPKLSLYKGERRSMLQAIVFAVCCLRLIGRRFDAIEVDSIPVLPVFVVRLVSGLRRRPMATTWHEVWGAEYWRHYLGTLGAVAAWLERAGLRMSGTIIAASPHTADRIRGVLGPDVDLTVTTSGIDRRRIVVEAGRLQYDIVTVGRLLAHKRIDLLLEAVCELARRGLPRRTLVIGHGPEIERLIRSAEGLGIGPLVDFLAVERADDVFRLLQQSRVFVLASEREGFGIAVLEALACGLPVVTTDAADNAAQELVRECGHGVVVAPNPKSVADGICLVEEGLENATLDGAQLSTWLDRYDWQSISRTVAGALQCEC
jgi:glycosyltransferase involved in cell wall biosynthesis